MKTAGRPSTRCRTTAPAATPVVFYVFDRDGAGGPRRDDARRSTARRALLETQGAAEARGARPLPRRRSNATLRDLIASVKAQGLEGLVAKRRDSRYEPGLRSGAWQKMRVNRGQEFVIGGYTVGTQHLRRAGLRLLRRATG